MPIPFFLSRFIFIILLVISPWGFAQEKLIFAIDLIRHGDRTPIHDIPNAPHPWKQGPGQLTPQGWLQEWQLGQALRQKYVFHYHLLSPQYVAGQIYARSTDRQRAIDSANAFLLGLYPLQNRPFIGKERASIPIHVVSREKDNLLTVKQPKNIFSLIALHFYIRHAWNTKTLFLRGKLKHWSHLTGMPLNNPQQVIALGDTLHIRQLHHVAPPPGMTPKDVKEIQALSQWAFIHYFENKKITHPMGHTFLTTVQTYLQQAIQHPSDLKYILFSAHDSTIMSVMHTLGIDLKTAPPFAANVNFALFQDGDTYVVKVNYNHQPLTLAGCTKNGCSLSQFKRLIQSG